LTPNSRKIIYLPKFWDGKITAVYNKSSLYTFKKNPFTSVVFKLERLFDYYGISLLDGYNMPINIYAYQKNQTHVGLINGNCDNIKWKKRISNNTCPENLSVYNDTKYMGCVHPSKMLMKGIHKVQNYDSCKVICEQNIPIPVYESPYCKPKLICESIGLKNYWPGTYDTIFANACPDCVTAYSDNEYSKLKNCYRTISDKNITFKITFCPTL
jgi:hypothetical protein